MNIDKFGRSIFTKYKQVQLIKESFPKDENNNFLFNNKRLKQIQDPLEEFDASNKNYVDKQVQHMQKTFLKDDDNNFIFNNKRLKQIHYPNEELDASNKKYVDDQITYEKKICHQL